MRKSTIYAPPPENLAQRVQQRLDELQINAFEADRRGDLTRGFTHELLIGRKQGIRGDNVRALAKALDVEEAWILGSTPSRLGPQGLARAMEGRIEPVVVTRPSEWGLPVDLPVYGSANGSMSGAVILGGGPLDYVRRPPSLSATKDAYAVFISGDSMIPEHNPGDLRFVHPHKPVLVEDSVILQVRSDENDEAEGFIKRLVRLTANKIVVRQHNPAETIEIDRAKVVGLHRVMTMSELFGI